MRVIVLLLGAILGGIGAKCIYDARELTNQYFHGNDKNKNVLFLRIIGFVILIIYIVLIFYLL